MRLRPVADSTTREALAIDRHLRDFDVRSAHAIEVGAPPSVTYRAVLDMDLGRSVPIVALLALRGLPHLITGKARPSRAITLDTFLQAGFVILEERPSEEFVMGAVGRFWRPDSGLIRIDADEFGGFAEPGYAKAVLGFTVDEHRNGSRLATETRVAGTDDGARRKFSLYWRMIGPFSGLIRRVMLDEVKRAAEKASSN